MRPLGKRSISPNDDFEDLQDDDDSSCVNYHGYDRKRRRGVVEKRRRDRINLNLTELRKLVPDAAQKQGSTKLEKAEILQMTVEFLHRIHKDGSVLNNEVHLLENRLLGFQECFAEVTRFLSALPVVNAVDEVLRKKLLSHLHSCIYRRDYEARTRLASLSSLASASSTSSSSSAPSSQPPPVPPQLSTRPTWPQYPPISNLPHPLPTPTVDLDSNEPPQTYWRPATATKPDETFWNHPHDFQSARGIGNAHPQQLQQAVPHNESQSTASSSSILGNYEETDSGNSTAHRFSPSEQDTSTDLKMVPTQPASSSSSSVYTFPQGNNNHFAQSNFGFIGYGYEYHQQHQQQQGYVDRGLQNQPGSSEGQHGPCQMDQVSIGGLPQNESHHGYYS